MAKCQKRYLVLVGFGLLVIIAAGVWMVFGRKTQIYEKTEEVFGNPLMGYVPCAWEETVGEDISLLYRILPGLNWNRRKENMTGRKSKEKIRLTDGEKKGNTWY